jgi:hypothetical protein
MSIKIQIDSSMKKILVVLTVVLSSLMLSSAAAEGASFGVRLDGIYVYVPIPFIGVQAGYDFGNNGEGFGVRASLQTNVFLATGVVADAFYRFPVDTNGSSAYVGAGAGAYFITAFSNQFAPEVHALIGYEGTVGSTTSWFIEATPMLLLPSIFTIGIHGGFIWRL